MKIMLSIAPWDMWEGEDDSIYPVGLAYLGAVLEKNNYDVELLNLTNSKWEDVKEDVIKKIETEKPDVFGIRILSNSRVSAKELLKEVKRVSPKSVIIAGGIHTTFLYNQILNHYPVDYAVLGEAEITLIELLDAIKNKKPVNEFKKINGVAFKDKEEI